MIRYIVESAAIISGAIVGERCVGDFQRSCIKDCPAKLGIVARQGAVSECQYALIEDAAAGAYRRSIDNVEVIQRDRHTIGDVKHAYSVIPADLDVRPQPRTVDAQSRGNRDLARQRDRLARTGRQ